MLIVHIVKTSYYIGLYINVIRMLKFALAPQGGYPSKEINEQQFLKTLYNSRTPHDDKRCGQKDFGRPSTIKKAVNNFKKPSTSKRCPRIVLIRRAYIIRTEYNLFR